MDDKKKQACDPVKTEEDLAEDGRVLMQVDDKLIGDDKLVASLTPKPDKKSNDNDPIY